MKKQLRIQVQSGGKKGKPRAAVALVWDGVQDPLSIVQKRFKTVKSLRNVKTNEEYKLEELNAACDDKVVILGSLEASQLAERKNKSPPPQDDAPQAMEALPAVLDNGFKLDRHARDRMYSRDISKDEVLQCLEAKESAAKITGGEKRMTTLSGDKIGMVVDKEREAVVTAFVTAEKTYPYPPELALTLQKLGLFQEMRDHLSILLRYNDDTKEFEFSGNERAIACAIRRLESHSRPEGGKGCIVKVPSERNQTGKVIGSRGSTINKIKKICGICRIDVRWEEESKQLVLTTTLLLDEQQRGNLYRLVDDVIHNRPLEALTATSIQEETPKTGDDKMKSKGSRQSRKAKGIENSLFHMK